MKATHMTEPASAAAAGFAAAKYGLLGKLASLFAVGALGAFLVVLADPMPDNTPRAVRIRVLFAQFLSAGVVALLFTLPVLRIAGATWEWARVAPGDIEGWLTLALPVGLILGALGWGLIGALLKLRNLIRDRGGVAAAARMGITPEQEVKP
jgi:hypothetical protein